MKTNRLTIQLAMAAMLFSFTACNNGAKKTADATEQQQETTVTTLQVDDVLAKAESLVDQEVAIEGLCTHICSHGGGKIFLMGSDDTKTIRVMAGEKIGAFEKECVNTMVTVKGILKEQRIDEAYLLNWEEQIKSQTEEKHGEGEGGCSSEKKARGEEANTPADRIADFRAKIAERQAKEGKNYLSFYHVEANEYAYK